jgi:hypothetical protein
MVPRGGDGFVGFERDYASASLPLRRPSIISVSESPLSVEYLAGP